MKIRIRNKEVKIVNTGFIYNSLKYFELWNKCMLAEQPNTYLVVYKLV